MVIYLGTLCIASETAERTCAHGAIKYDGRCFWFVDTKASWADANIMCSRFYGDHVTLTTIRDVATNNFIRSQSEATLWIGLHEGHGEGQWRWVDHSILSGNGNHVYKNWEPSAPTPDSLTKNCAVMYRGSEHWRDVGCKKKHKFVCSELPSSPICSNGGTFFRDRCYWATERALPWEEANTYCSEHFGPGTYLTTAKDWEVNLFLSRLIYPGIWLGLHDLNRENDWKWIDNSTLEFSNWRSGEPNNVDEEDCAVLHYGDATWNDQPCGGKHTVRNTNRFICSVPPCFEDTTYSGMSSFNGLEDLEIYDDVICVTTECRSSCIDSSACNSTTGACMCVKQFPHMVCDAAEWQISIESSVVNATAGGSLSIKCMHNCPQEDISFLTWSRSDGRLLDEMRTSIHNVFYKGYSLLEITNVDYLDAGMYHCQGLISTPDGNTNLYTSDSVIITVSEATTEESISTTLITTVPREDSNAILTSTTTDHPVTMPSTTPSNTFSTKRKLSYIHTTIGDITSIYMNKKTPTVKDDSNEIPITTSSRFTKVAKDEGNQIQNHIDNKVNSEASKDLKVNTYHRGRGATAIIVILAVMVALLLIAVVGLMLKVRKLEYTSFGASRLVEMSDRF